MASRLDEVATYIIDLSRFCDLGTNGIRLEEQHPTSIETSKNSKVTYEEVFMYIYVWKH